MGGWCLVRTGFFTRTRMPDKVDGRFTETAALYGRSTCMAELHDIKHQAFKFLHCERFGAITANSRQLHVGSLED